MKATKATQAASSSVGKVVNRTFGDNFRCLTLASLAAISFYGGTWQIQRRKQKIEYLTKVNKGLKSDAIACPTNLTQEKLSELEYRKVYFNGKLDISNEIILSPRRAPPNVPPKPEYDIGGNAIAPCLLDNGQTILINRGWIPKQMAAAMHEKEKEKDNSDNNNNTTEKTENSGKFQKMMGLLLPFETGSNFGDSINDQLFWPYLTKEAICKKWNDIGSQLSNNENNIPITVELIGKEKNEKKGKNKNVDISFPLSKTERDFLAVAVSPSQHSIYIFICFTTGLVSAFYTYYFWKYPASVAKAIKKVRKPGSFQYTQNLNAKR